MSDGILVSGWLRIILFGLVYLLVSSCSYQVNEDVTPDVVFNQPYSLKPNEDGKKALSEGPWWRVFEDPHLDHILVHALSENFDLKQAEARLRQAEMVHGQATARIFPELTGSLDSSSTWPNKGDHEDNLATEFELAWEVDLWRRLSSAREAAGYSAEAAKETLFDTALLISAQVVDTYFQIIEQQQQLVLLVRQIKVNQTFLELIELRFANGAASVVDVYQQRQLLAGIRAQIPVARARLRSLKHRFLVLLGRNPSDELPAMAEQLPNLAPLPQVGLPADLLINRPDLRAAHKRLVAADYRVAEAVANRLPQVRLFASGGIDGSGLVSDNLFVSLLADVVAPIFDWNRRKMEVEHQRAVVDEELARYSQSFLVAIEEVENVLWQEHEQLELINALEEQLSLARANLAESRNRYMQGLTDYLPVLTVLHSMQGLERDLLQSRRELISQRILLHRALGGVGIKELLPLMAKASY